MQILIADILGNLGIALFHSIWQGAVAFLLVIGVRTLTHDRHSAVRYAFQVLILFACFAAFIATFATYHFSAASGGTTGLIEFATAAATGVAQTPASGASALALDQLFARYAPWFGLFWCVGFGILSARYALDYRFTQKLRSEGLSDVPAKWQNRFDALARLNGLSRYTGFFVSSRVDGPVTLGTLKPIILVPMEFFTRIPADQIEAILLHEIAHIRRNDYFVNLLQTAIKTVFFYHPAITYICRKIDEDREYACDDYAIGRTNNPTALAKGLAAIRLSAPSASFAMAASGNDSPLLARLKRIAGQRVNRRSHGPFASTLAASALIAAVVASTVTSHTAEASPHGYDQADEKPNYRFETIEKHGQKVTAKIASDGTRWMRIHNGWHDLDKSDIAKTHLQSLAGGPTEDGQSTPTPPKPPVPPKLSQRSFDTAHAEADAFHQSMQQFEIDMEHFEAEMERYVDELSEYHFDGREISDAIASAHAKARYAEASAKHAETRLEHQLQREEQRIERQIMLKEREIEREEMQRKRELERELQRQYREPKPIEMDVFESQLTDQLVQDGLIKSGSSTIQFEISRDGMIVNGTPIPDRLEDNYCQMVSDAGIRKTHQTKITIKNNGESISISSHN